MDGSHEIRPYTPWRLQPIIVLAVVLVALGGAGYGLWSLLKNGGGARGSVLPVETMVVAAEDVVEWFEGYGRANPTRVVRVGAEVSGRIVERLGHSEAGQAYESLVQQGQVLLRLDDTEYQEALTRARRHQEQDGGSGAALPLRSAVAEARLNVERCTIRAPFDGRLRNVHVEVGDRVAPGVVVLTLIDPGTVEIPIQLPTLVFDHLSEGSLCHLESESQPGTFWEGLVTRIGSVGDQRTRTFTVYVEVDNTVQAQPLLPGTFVDAKVAGPVHRDAILLPRDVCRGGRVFVVEEGTARLVRVTTEHFIGDRTLIRGDLEPGDEVILSPLDQVRDGEGVRVTGDSVRP